MGKRVVSKLLEQEVAKRSKQRIQRFRENGESELFSPEEQEQLARLAEQDPVRALSFAAQETLVKKTRTGRQDIQEILREQMLLTQHKAQFRLTCSPASYMKSRLEEALVGEQWMAIEAILWALQEADVPPPGAQREWLAGAMPDGAFVIAHDASDEGNDWRALVVGKTRELAFERIFDDLAGGPVSQLLPPAARTQEVLQELASRLIAINFDDKNAPPFSCVSLAALQAGLRGADKIEVRLGSGEWSAVNAQFGCDLLRDLSDQAQGLTRSSLEWLERTLSPQARLAEGLARWNLLDSASEPQKSSRADEGLSA